MEGKSFIPVDEHLSIEYYDDGDVYDLLQNIGDKDVSKALLEVPYPYTISDAIAFINHTVHQRKDFGINVNWCIRQDGLVIGGIGRQVKYGIKSHKDEVGYWLGKDYWGQGIMTKVLSVFCDFLHDEQNLHRIEAPIYTWNEASGRVLEKCRFEREGLFRHAYLKDGKWVDAYMYARVYG